MRLIQVLLRFVVLFALPLLFHEYDCWLVCYILIANAVGSYANRPVAKYRFRHKLLKTSEEYSFAKSGNYHFKSSANCLQWPAYTLLKGCFWSPISLFKMSGYLRRLWDATKIQQACNFGHIYNFTRGKVICYQPKLRKLRETTMLHLDLAIILSDGK